MKNGTARLLAIFAAALVLTGCAQLMGEVRHDFDDQQGDYAASGFDRDAGPTVGGRWTERGYLNEDQEDGSWRSNPRERGYLAVGDGGRAPAAESQARFDGRSWVTPESAEANRRDAYRQPATADNEPVTTANTAVLEPPVKRMYKNGRRATRADFIDESQNEGSLWAPDGQTNFFFSKNKVRGAGDIISITTDETMVRDIVSEVKRSLTPAERQAELATLMTAHEKALLLAEAAKEKGRSDTVSSSQAAPARKSGEENGGDYSAMGDSSGPPAPTLNDVDLSKVLEIKAGDTIMGEIVERFPNGNYKIRGAKRVLYKNGAARLVSVVAVVRSADISEDDVVNSGKLYEYRLEANR